MKVRILGLDHPVKKVKDLKVDGEAAHGAYSTGLIEVEKSDPPPVQKESIEHETGHGVIDRTGLRARWVARFGRATAEMLEEEVVSEFGFLYLLTIRENKM